MAELTPTSLKRANAFVSRHHRHSMPTQGHKFSIGLTADGELVGVAIAGRPISRHRDDGRTIEILRVCVVEDAAPQNACSMLYGACCRAGRAMGYIRAVTYSLQTETGASLRAAGFRVIREVPAQSWDSPSRPRKDRHELRDRRCWERCI